MSDFYQTGVIATLHMLTRDQTERLDRELSLYSRVNPLGLVLPALYSEFQHPAMRNIVDELSRVQYLQRIVVAIGRCSWDEYLEARAFFRNMKVPVNAMWMEHPLIEELLQLLAERDVPAGQAGKGRTCWLSFGQILAWGDCEVIALHDCDIRNYTRELLDRLVYPVMHPNLGFEFSKGFYARVSNQLHGRVMRLFFTPLVRAIQDITPEIPFLRYLDSFRYALSGEFAMQADLARVNRIPDDWGLEVGVLSEVYRNVAPSRVCQVAVLENYEHKHQELSADDASRGLRRMTADIAKSLFRSLAQTGVVLTTDHFRTLQVYYVRYAQDTIHRYHADAILNGLNFDRHAEDSAVNTFARSLREASGNFMEDPLGAPQIPNWNRVAAAVPDVFDRILQAQKEMDRAASATTLAVTP